MLCTVLAQDWVFGPGYLSTTKAPREHPLCMTGVSANREGQQYECREIEGAKLHYKPFPVGVGAHFECIHFPVAVPGHYFCDILVRHDVGLNSFYSHGLPQR